jgi:hypothetical protein
MKTTALRPVAAIRFRRGPKRQSVEILLERIGDLAAERQELRRRAASAAVLERNRLELVRAQWELSYALIDRHLPAVERAA